MDQNEIVAITLGNVDYNRQRINPRPGDGRYLPLSDLRSFLAPYIRREYGTVLDYGCGGSPYRELFICKEYLRADYVKSEGLDYSIHDDGSIDVPSNSCDLVLSTQVLEHVFDPDLYLNEAFRVLKSGGILILTTHGTWEDHGCPFDFWRWTADGLARVVGKARFHIMERKKLTTGIRAVCFYVLAQTGNGQHSKGKWLVKILRKCWHLIPSTCLHRIVDSLTQTKRVVDADEPGHSFYLCLGVLAQKPDVPEN